MTTHTYVEFKHAQLVALKSTWHKWVWSKGVANRNVIYSARGPSQALNSKEGRFSNITNTVMILTSGYDAYISRSGDFCDDDRQVTDRQNRLLTRVE